MLPLLLAFRLASALLLPPRLAPPVSRHSIARLPCMSAAASDDSLSFRQRLRETNVDPRLLAEIVEMPRHPPLLKPFGSAPRFVAAAKTEASLPPESLPEIALIGRSNVGKSSLLNAFTGMQSLAKVSDKPGKTQSLNIFQVGRGEQQFHVVDMPGYGFAFAREEDIATWTQLSASYLQRRRTLRLVLVLVDARVGLKPPDTTLLQFLEANKVAYVLVLTKADAAGPPKRLAQLASLVQQSVGRARFLRKPLAVVSSRTGGGIGKLQRRCIEAVTGKDPMADVDGGWDRSKGRGAATGRGGQVEAGLVEEIWAARTLICTYAPKRGRDTYMSKR
ncbi:hypothetical protein AB1Y20_011456 [Prymnesium parvum]|uniref:EngB-type G domain-containing protein n=1 Tax=Prymnesium parvum TaxID=97485 RepID=A0AB34IMX1_PRYPA